MKILPTTSFVLWHIFTSHESDLYTMKVYVTLSDVWPDGLGLFDISASALINIP